MKYNQIVLVFAFSGLVVSAAAAQTPSTTSTPNATVSSTVQTAEIAGALQAMAEGDNWVATNTLRRAVAKDASVVNRFNLATGYQRTNRLIEAKAIYSELLVDGEQTELVSSAKKGVIGGESRVFNVSDEAASRLVYIAWRQGGLTPRPAFAVTSSEGAPSAELASVATSAEVGAVGSHEVSDARARQLDTLVDGDTLARPH
jgi:hypothetical protein